MKKKMKKNTSTSEKKRVVSRDKWLTARRKLLAREKKLTREYDAVRALRQRLPWVKIEKEYVFEGPNGKENLSDLFQGRSQLILRHFMFGPGWKEGCVGCSFASDHVGGALVHLENHDVSYVAVSRAPFAEIDAFRKRMGWNFRWLSSHGSDFNYDFHVSMTPEQLSKGKAFQNFELRKLRYKIEESSGLSVFYKDADGNIFQTYGTHARGDEGGDTTYFYLDLTPKGRDENGPTFSLGDWVRHHDRYGAGGHVAPDGRYVAGK